MLEVPVLIAGGGPVGMTLAMELASRRVSCMLVERNQSTTQHPKMDMTNSRSMELFRRLGLSDKLREVTVPEDHPYDVSWITSLSGHELHRFPYPSVAEMRGNIRETNDGTQPLEPPMRASQVEIEPVLKREIEGNDLIDVRFGTSFEDLHEEENSVVATIRSAYDNDVEQVRCKYLIGCDGGGSRVRSILGIELSGEFQIMRRFTTHFKSDARDILQRWGIAWHYQSVYGTLVSQNDHDTWTLHTRIAPEDTEDSLDPYKFVQQFAGIPIEFETLVANPWSPHLVVSDSYGRGRILLAGDAVHQYIPTGGYGMNTGIGDAIDLGWKLGAVLNGFGGPGLLDSYEMERRPIGIRNCEASRSHNDVRVKIGALYRQYSGFLEEETGEGEKIRQIVAGKIKELGNDENESAGIEYGYSYTNSPVIFTETDSELNEDPLVYVPATSPGSRLPSVYLPDGRPLFDCLDKWFTLLVCGKKKPEYAGLIEAARSRGVPISTLSIDDPGLATIYETSLVLVRPDQHVAWRGRGIDDIDDGHKVLNRVLGFNS